MRSAAEIKDDIASLRRVAISLRDQRQVSSAIQCEAILREREAELAATFAQPHPVQEQQT